MKAFQSFILAKLFELSEKLNIRQEQTQHENIVFAALQSKCHT